MFAARGHDAAGGREVPAPVSQRDAAGQQRGVHEGEVKGQQVVMRHRSRVLTDGHCEGNRSRWFL